MISSLIQAVILLISLASQLLLVKYFGLSYDLDLYYQYLGYTSGVFGLISVALNYLLANRFALKAISIRKKMLVYYINKIVYLSLFISVFYCARLLFMDGASAEIVYLFLLVISAQFISNIISILNSYLIVSNGLRYTVVSASIPNLLVILGLVSNHLSGYLTLATAVLIGTMLQLLLLRIRIGTALLRMNKVKLSNFYPIIRSLTPIVLSSVCFSSFTIIDAYFGEKLGVGVITTQSLLNRIIVAYSTVISFVAFTASINLIKSYVLNSEIKKLNHFIVRNALFYVLSGGGLGLLCIPMSSYLEYFSLNIYGVNFKQTEGFIIALQYMLYGSGFMMATTVLFRVFYAYKSTLITSLISVAWFVMYTASVAIMSSYEIVNSLQFAYLLSWGLTFIFSYLIFYKFFVK